MFEKVSFLDKVFFTKHLSVMLKSGIVLNEAVAILKDQSKNSAFKKVLSGVLADLDNGQSLSVSLGKFPKTFDFLYLAVVSTGEDSGTLEDNLDYLAKELTKQYEFRKKVQGALLYPAIIFVTMSVVGAVISLFVLPQLTELFKSLDVELPLATRILLAFAQTMKTNGPIIIAALFGFIVLIVALIKTPFVKPIWHSLILKLPIFGPYFQNIQLALFCRTFGIMLKSGLPIVNALKATEESAENMVYKSYIKRLLKAVEGGKTLESELITNRYPYMPLIVTRMIGVGEKTGKLDEVLLYLGEFYEEEVDGMTKNLPTLIEPILLIFMAGMVGFLAYAIISPIYQFTGAVGK